MPLTATRPAPAFGAEAHRATWNGREVLAYLGPPVDGAVASSIERSREAIGRQVEGTWPLLDVVDQEGRAAWLYPVHEGVSLLVLVAHPPPMRVYLSMAAELLLMMESLAEQQLEHPGPRADDVLVDRKGGLHLGGFVGPSHADTSRHPTQLGTSSAARVYRFGVLACELLGGGTVKAAPTDETQRKSQRRAAIRIMTRPGPLLDERVRNLIVQCLCFHPAERPEAHAVIEALHTAARGLTSHPSPAAWAGAELAALAKRVEDPEHTTLDVDTSSLRTVAPSKEDVFEEDDVTAISAGSTPGGYRRVELGSIPVTVGPPPEVARKRPTLPPDLFDDDADPTTEDDKPAPEPPPPEVRRARTLAWVSAAMVVVAIGLAIYLFWAS